MAKRLTVWEKIQSVPHEQWINLAIIVGIIAVILYIIACYRRSDNKLWFLIIFSAIGFISFINMIYMRNEPKFLTPIVERISLFLPTQDSYNQKQKH
jgi:TctA family transporter